MGIKRSRRGSLRRAQSRLHAVGLTKPGCGFAETLDRLTSATSETTSRRAHYPPKRARKPRESQKSALWSGRRLSMVSPELKMASNCRNAAQIPWKAHSKRP
jgi:hypothetical protein